MLSTLDQQTACSLTRNNLKRIRREYKQTFSTFGLFAIQSKSPPLLTSYGESSRHEPTHNVTSRADERASPTAQCHYHWRWNIWPDSGHSLTSKWPSCSGMRYLIDLTNTAIYRRVALRTESICTRTWCGRSYGSQRTWTIQETGH